MIRKILIANRGEIAVRILRACRDLGVRAAVVYSAADRAALHVRLADEAHPIGPAPSRESYLSIDKIIAVARDAGCDAVHPGYGFLSENPLFARACEAAKVTFIGPSAAVMQQLGSKTAARHVAHRVGVPTVPGTLDPIDNLNDAASIAEKIGFPIVLKAVAGGGGKGIRRVDGGSELASAWRDATSEAHNAFGDGRLFLEKYLSCPRHIEIQVMGDHHGNMIYLGERECSVQRRYQKVIEEAPSSIMTPDLRKQMGEAAVAVARAGGYVNAGTIEFLVDDDRHFYFLEMNTRLQVEHPVTEMVTSVDLVKLQIRIAGGEPLPFGQADLSFRGHAIECRIYAEDPANNFFPSPGKIIEHRPPAGPGIRVDGGVHSGWVVPTEYDSMLDKLIVWGSDRTEAIARLGRALREYYATGIRTNVSLFLDILASSDFQLGNVHTRWLDDFLRQLREKDSGLERQSAQDSTSGETAAIVAAALWQMSKASALTPGDDGAGRQQLWKIEGRREQLDRASGR